MGETISDGHFNVIFNPTFTNNVHDIMRDNIVNNITEPFLKYLQFKDIYI